MDSNLLVRWNEPH